MPQHLASHELHAILLLCSDSLSPCLCQDPSQTGRTKNLNNENRKDNRAISNRCIPWRGLVRLLTHSSASEPCKRGCSSSCIKKLHGISVSKYTPWTQPSVSAAKLFFCRSSQEPFRSVSVDESTWPSSSTPVEPVDIL